MHETFLQAALIEPPRILGVQLRPFSAGHILILEAIENPYAFEGTERTVEDLATALFFCSRTLQEGRRVLAHRERDLTRIFRVWARRFWMARGPWGRRRAELAMVEFEDYQTAYCELPEHYQKGDPLTAPYLYSVVCGLTLATEGAVGPDEAWDYPLSLAVCYMSTIGDLKGGKTLITGSAAESQIMTIRDGGAWRTLRPDGDISPKERVEAARRQRERVAAGLDRDG